MAGKDKKSPKSRDKVLQDYPYSDIFPGKWDYSKAGQTFVILKAKIKTPSMRHDATQIDQEGNEESPEDQV